MAKPSPEMQNLRLPLIAFCLLTLAACATQKPTDALAPKNWAERQQQLQTLQHWTASGKLALRSEKASESATMRWRQSGQSSELNLSGPLGVGATTIISDGDLLHVHQSGKTRILDISTPQAVVHSTGWDLPLQALPYWLKGLPSPDHPIQKQTFTADTGQLQSLQQDDWTVTYDKYSTFQAFVLPTRLLVERDGTRVKVIVRNWRDLAG